MDLIKRRFIDLSSSEQAIVREKLAALARFFQSCSVGFFDDSRQFFGSGTLVRHGGRLFIATADHVARQVKARWRDVSLFHGAALEKRVGRVDHKLKDLGAEVWLGAEPRDRDVAAVELPDAALKELAPMECANEENIFVDGVAKSGTNVWLLGTPMAVRAPEQAAAGNPNLECMAVLISHLRNTECSMEAHEGDGKREGYGSPAESDLHVEWTEALWERDGWGALPEAGGMSGGGVWACDAPLDAVWTPRKAKLLGIAWHQRRDLGCIRAVTMNHWVAFADIVVRECSPPVL